MLTNLIGDYWLLLLAIVPAAVGLWILISYAMAARRRRRDLVRSTTKEG